MAVHPDFDSFRAALPPAGALLGLDLGEKTVGVAVSDLRRGVATPLETIRRKKFTLDAARLLEIAAARGVAGIVLGLPLNMDGSEGPRCQTTRAFARNLSRLSDLPIGFWDERLSTVAAERALRVLVRNQRGDGSWPSADLFFVLGVLARAAADPRFTSLLNATLERSAQQLALVQQPDGGWSRDRGSASLLVGWRVLRAALSEQREALLAI